MKRGCDETYVRYTPLVGRTPPSLTTAAVSEETAAGAGLALGVTVLVPMSVLVTEGVTESVRLLDGVMEGVIDTLAATLVEGDRVIDALTEAEGVLVGGIQPDNDETRAPLETAHVAVPTGVPVNPSAASHTTLLEACIVQVGLAPDQ